MEKEKNTKVNYMYKVAFSSGSVFSASMIDTLLYQAFSKPYLIEFVRLLIGINQNDGSGSLSAVCGNLVKIRFENIKYFLSS